MIDAREELRSINRQLAELRSFMEVSDIVNRREAIQIMNVTPDTFNTYVSTGKVIVFSRNKAGQSFFSRRQLLGLK